jgi:hypothetical protein
MITGKYWVSTNLFYYYLFRTDEPIYSKKIPLWFRQNPLYIKSNDETIKSFILPSNPYKNCSYKEYHDIKYKFIIIDREREREERERERTRFFFDNQQMTEGMDPAA